MFRLRQISVFDVRITSLMMCGISLACHCGYTGVVLYWTLNPSLPVENDYVTGKKRRPYSQFRSVCLSLNSFFYIAASLNVSILWLEVAIASKRFKRINRPQLSKNYKYAVFTLDLIFALVIGFTLWFAPSSASIAAVVLFIIILALYIYSAYEITKVMKESFHDTQIDAFHQNSRTDSINKSLLLIKRYAIQYIVLMLLWILFLVLGSAQYQSMFKRAWKDDEIPYYMVFFDIAFLFLIATALALVKYIHDASIKSTNSKSKTPDHADNHIATSATGPTGGVVVPALDVDRVNQ